jgi:hypothetical protein
MVTAATALTTGLAGAYWRFSKESEEVVPAPVVFDDAVRPPVSAGVTS